MDFESGSVTAGTLDSAQAYKGTKSLKVSSSNSQFLSLNVPSSNFWVRAFVRSDGSQQYPTQGFARPHGVFLRAIDGSKQLRVGDHRCQLDINRDGGGWDDLEMISGSYGADDTICADKVGARMIPKTWYCLEVHYNGPGSEVQVFWDNQNVEQLHVKATRIATNADKKIENGYNNQYGNSTVKWGPANFTKLEFGYQSFNNLGTTPNMTVWYDNVATSSQRIGCGSDYMVKQPLDASTRYPGYAAEEFGTTSSSSSSSSSGSSGSTSSSGGGTAIISETFEGGTSGSAPAGWQSIITHSQLPNTSSSTYSALVDGSRAHSGSKSLRVKVDNSTSSPVFLVKQVPQGVNKLFVRAWVYSSTQLGGAGSSGPGNHGHFMGTMTNVSNNPTNEIRYGIVDGTRLGGMTFIGDAFTFASASDLTAKVPANTWTCVEYALFDEGGRMYAWINDKQVMAAENGNAWQNGNGADRVSSMDLAYVHFGWRGGFGSVAKPSDIWFDDIVVSDARVGCN